MALLFLDKSAAEKKNPETHKDIIQKAFSLSLQKDRIQARTVLWAALNREQQKAAHKKELSEALTKVCRVFYSERAQQNYEIALSLMPTDKELALAKLNEALRAEPENLQIELAILRVHLSNSDCGSAQKLIDKYAEQVAFDEELKLALAQTRLCLEDFEGFEKLLPTETKKPTQFKPYWLTALAERQYKSSQMEEALKTIELAEASPESHYWRWKIQVASKKEAHAAGTRYMTVCKSLSSRAYREHLLEPFLCQRLVEVETWLKKNNNTEE